MFSAKRVHCKVGRCVRLFILAPLFITQLLIPHVAYAQQDATLFRDELQLLYLVNLQRRQAGVAPLAWNAEMTESARWFARDAVVAMSPTYCGHTDSLGRSPDQRIREEGYTGYGTTAENAMCGYVPPANTVAGWMDSAGHRANLLNPNLREAGAGYYRNSTGDGYAVLDLAYDRDYAPLVIDDEALTTADRIVRLYLYDQDTGDGWSGPGATTEIMISNLPDFAGAKWEPYVAERDWTLEAGEGWRTVYVKTRDRLGQTTIVHDSIYLGSRMADDALALEYATHVDDGFTLSGLPGGYTHVQFSLNWLADDRDGNFKLLDGQGEYVDDAAAKGGSAFRLAGGSKPALAWSWSSSPFGKAPAVAYFRLKAADNSSSQEIATLSISDGANEVAKRLLVGTDFAAAGQYQEFAVPFTPSEAGNGLIVLFVRRSGSSDIVWDTTSLYTPPVPISDPCSFQAPNRYYRSSGIQVRLVTPGESGKPTTSFSEPLAAYPHLGELEDNAVETTPLVRVNPTSLVIVAASGGGSPPAAQVALTCTGCGNPIWQASSSVPWLSATMVDGQLSIHADPAGLADGIYHGIVTLTVPDRSDIPPVALSVSLIVGDVASLFSDHVFMPAIVRR
jgi:uncharacterized protein YkwD